MRITKFVGQLKKTKTLSEISRDAAQVFFASVMVDPIINGSFRASLFFAGFGISMSIWVLSLLLAKE
jgi:hypothetical protein